MEVDPGYLYVEENGLPTGHPIHFYVYVSSRECMLSGCLGTQNTRQTKWIPRGGFHGQLHIPRRCRAEDQLGHRTQTKGLRTAKD